MQRQYNFANLPPECIIQMNVDNQIQSFNCYPAESHIHKKDDIKIYLKPLTFCEMWTLTWLSQSVDGSLPH